MTKILVFSDSHDDISNMQKVIDAEIPDIILHLGDGWDDIEQLHREYYYDIPMEHVKGNCDYNSESDIKFLTVAGKNIFMTHGDRYYVKSRLDVLINEGIERGADIVLFGHTHNPVNIKTDNMIVINPGSIKNTKLRTNEPSYAVITIDEDSSSKDNITSEVKYVYDI